MTNETPAPEVEPGCPDCMVGLHGYPRWRRFRLPNGERCANDWHAPEVGLTEAEQLAEVLYRDRQTRTVPDTVPEVLDARAILASGWLAERDAHIKADAIAQERAERDAAWAEKIERTLTDPALWRWVRTTNFDLDAPENNVSRSLRVSDLRRALLSSDATEAGR